MKKLSLLLWAISFVMASNSQTKDVTDCYNYLRTNEYEKAKESIDKASVDPKAVNSTRCWLCYGITYRSINDSCMFNKTQKYCDLDPNALLKSYSGFLKAWVLNFKNPEFRNINTDNEEGMNRFYSIISTSDVKYLDDGYYTDVLTGIAGLTNSFVNIGLKKFQDNNFSDALVYFEKALFLSQLNMAVNNLKEPDTEIIYLTALAFEKSGNYKRAGEMYKLLIDNNLGKTNEEKARLYIFEARTYLADNDTLSYLNILKTGINKLPLEKEILSELINFCIFSNKLILAKETLLSSIKIEPENKLLYYNLGFVSEKLGEIENAINYYLRAIEIDQKYFEAVYNLGVLYFNRAVDVNTKCGDIPPTKTKEYEDCKKQAEAGFKEALPHLENAYKIDPKDKYTLSDLKTLYAWFKDTAKYEKVKKELEELEKK